MFDEIPELGTCSLCGAYTKLTDDGWCETCDAPTTEVGKKRLAVTKLIKAFSTEE